MLDKASTEAATLMQSSAEGISKNRMRKSLHFRVRIPPLPLNFFSTLSMLLCRSYRQRVTQNQYIVQLNLNC